MGSARRFPSVGVSRIGEISTRQLPPTLASGQRLVHPPRPWFRPAAPGLHATDHVSINRRTRVDRRLKRHGVQFFGSNRHATERIVRKPRRGSGLPAIMIGRYFTVTE